MIKGDYARTKGGEIGKISTIIDDKVFINTNQYYSQIIKSSPNIIDLIEVGDYVNGYEVLQVMNLIPDKAIETMRSTGFDVATTKRETSDSMEIIIAIPKCST